MQTTRLKYAMSVLVLGVASCGWVGESKMPLDNDPEEWGECKRVRTAKGRAEGDDVLIADVRIGYEYSASGRLELVKYDESSQYDGDPDTIDGEADWTVEYIYDDQGRLEQKAWDTERNQFVEYWYNEAGRVVKKLRKRDLYWTVWYREYDSSGERLLEERYRRVSVDEGFPKREADRAAFGEIRTFRYADGRLDEKRIDRKREDGHPDGKVDERLGYEWSDGRKERVTVDQRPFAGANDGALDRERTYHYGSEGRLQRVDIDGTYGDEGETVDGEVEWREVYQYDDRGNLTEFEKKYGGNDGSFEAQRRRKHEYACPGS